MKKKKIKEQILEILDTCYAQGEWGSEDPERTFKQLERKFKRYLKEGKNG